MKQLKSTKFSYYLSSILKTLIPRVYLQYDYRRLLAAIDTTQWPYIQDRVNYYNQLDTKFCLDARAKTYRSYRLKGVNSSYYFDFREIARYFDRDLAFAYHFGDVITVPSQPSFVKSRPIGVGNTNAIMMKLDKLRHFVFVDDKMAFKNKKDQAVYRGPCYQPHRQRFVQSCYQQPMCDIGDTNKNCQDKLYYKPYMCQADQLKYKFIISVEGNDVATNLKWIMSSNSLCLMTKPKFETWFMEGRLIPDYHYVQLQADYSDLNDKIAYYTQNPDAALTIIDNAHRFVRPFLDLKQERIIALLVMKKYFTYLEKSPKPA